MVTQTLDRPVGVGEIVEFLVETFRSHANDPGASWSASTKIDSVGIDSFDFVEILFKIEDQYGVDLDYNANVKFTELTTIKDLAQHIEQAYATKPAK